MNWPTPSFFVVLLGLFLSSVGSSAQQLHVLESSGEIDYRVTRQMSYCVDSSSVRNLDEIKKETFVNTENDGFQFTASDAAIWFKLPIYNDTREELILKLNQPILDTIDYYLVAPDGYLLNQYRTGSAFPFEQRMVVGNHPKFIIPPGNYTCYLRVASTYSIQFHANIYNAAGLRSDNNSELILQGIYLGFCIFIIAYSFFLFVSTRDRIYNYYILHIIATALITLHLSGCAFQYFWPGCPVINQYEPLIFGLGIFTTLFSIRFLQLSRVAPRWNRLLWGVIIANIPVFILPFIGFKNAANVLVHLIGMVGCSLMLIAGVVAWLRGYRHARFYVIAFSIFLIGVVISVLSRIGILPNYWVFIHASQIGSSIDIILLSLAIADRYNALTVEKELADREVIRQTSENRKLIEEQNQRLQSLVEERTNELEKSNRALETQKSELEELHHYNNRIFSVIAHDLRGGVGNLMSAFDQFGEEPANYTPDLLRSFGKISRETFYLLENLLTWGQISGGDFKPYTGKIKPELPVEAALRRTEPLAEGKSIQVTYRNYAPNVEIIADTNYLGIVIRNLLNNAVKFTEEHGKIAVECKTVDGNWILTVSDTGVGMTSDKIAAFNERSSLQSSDGTSGESGTGLGLNICREIVDLFNGEIEVSSMQNQGSTFTISIPLAQESALRP